MKTKDAHSAWLQAHAAEATACVVWNEANAAVNEAHRAWSNG